MALVASYAERVVVLHHGQIIADGSPASIFQQAGVLAQASLLPPPVTILAQALRPYGFGEEILTVAAFCQAYSALLEHRSRAVESPSMATDRAGT
jgi:energy-coupling factor transport system ATP-binding protein